MAAVSSCAVSRPSAESLAEALTGRYEVLREIGRGGMASVYLADDVRHGRHVAVKVMLPELAAGVGVDRFLREIRLLAAGRVTFVTIYPVWYQGRATHIHVEVTSTGGRRR